MGPFKIHPQLLADGHRWGNFSLCHVLLHKNALVPETDAADLLELPEALGSLAMAEAAMISRFVKEDLGRPKVNFAAIGNAVPQLHLHMVGRKPGDGCWPLPVWGHLTAMRNYSAAELESITRLLESNYGLWREQRTGTQ